jgi:hypothetical protein
MTFNTLSARFLTFFRSGASQKAIDQVAAFAPSALPYIAIAAQIITGITPTTMDDQALALLHVKYPHLFDGSLKTGAEVKLYALGIASELMGQKFPSLSTSVARASVQMAYVGKTA